MNRSAAAAPERPTLQQLAGGIFSLVMTLRQTGRYGQEPELRDRLRRYLDAMDQHGLRCGYPQGDLTEVKFPLVAFIDEVILGSSWEHRESWRDRPLQLDLFGERTAGQRFFKRLEELRREGSARREILEIYHLCLTLGFAGSYRISGLQALQPVIDALRRDLGYLPLDQREVRLAPNGLPRSGGGPDQTLGAGRFWRFWGAAAGVAALLFLGSWLWVNHAANQTVSVISSGG
jgi:type VI secretion system protein ImpK